MPQNLVFAISRQYHQDDGFDDLTKYKKDKRFKIIETLWSKSIRDIPMLGIQFKNYMMMKSFIFN